MKNWWLTQLQSILFITFYCGHTIQHFAVLLKIYPFSDPEKNLQLLSFLININWNVANLYSWSCHKNRNSVLQAHFFKKSPFGDLQVQNGRHEKKFSRQKTKNVKGRTLHVAKKNCEGGGHFMMYYTTGQCAKRHILNTLLCCSKFTHSCRVSEWWDGKRERQMMLPLVPLIKCVLLLIITGASRRLEPVIKCCSFLSFFQCLVSRAPLSAVTESLS